MQRRVHFDAAAPGSSFRTESEPVIAAELETPVTVVWQHLTVVSLAVALPVGVECSLLRAPEKSHLNATH